MSDKRLNIQEKLFDSVTVTDNRSKKKSYIPKTLEIEFIINQKQTERFKEDWYILIGLYTDGNIQILTKGIGNYITKDQMDEIIRVRGLINER